MKKKKEETKSESESDVIDWLCLIFMQPPTRPDLTQGHFIVRGTHPELRFMNDHLRKPYILSAFSTFVAPQVPSNEQYFCQGGIACGDKGQGVYHNNTNPL